MAMRPTRFISKRAGRRTNVKQLSAETGVTGVATTIITKPNGNGPSVARTLARDDKAGETFLEPGWKTSEFPLTPAALVQKAKDVVAADFGVHNPDLLADDFSITLPVVGPLPKAAFLQAFKGFDIKSALSLQERCFGFTADPVQPGRIWFFSRGKATFSKRFLRFEPTGETFLLTPQVSSLIFNRDGKVSSATAGYPVDRLVGDCGGLGGAFGIVYAIAPGFLPFPEAQPMKRSWQFKLFSAVGATAAALTPKKKDAGKPPPRFTPGTGLLDAPFAVVAGLVRKLNPFKR